MSRKRACPIQEHPISKVGILFTLLFPLGREYSHEMKRQLEVRRKAAKGEIQ
ncbi:MAG TPA: hypothetical protein VF784_07080 [Anaerolineales bacterium]